MSSLIHKIIPVNLSSHVCDTTHHHDSRSRRRRKQIPQESSQGKMSQIIDTDLLLQSVSRGMIWC